MRERVLYIPDKKEYPFVDTMWRQGNELFAVQVTVSENHPKTFEAFRDSWLKKHLGVKINNIGNATTVAPTRVNLIYVLLPKFVNQKRTENVPASFAWKKSDATRKTKGTSLSDIQTAPTPMGKVKKLAFFIAKPHPDDAWDTERATFDEEPSGAEAPQDEA